MSTDDGMRAAIEALPVGTVVRLGHTFPETGDFQGSQYLRTRHGLRYIGPGRDDTDAITLHQQVQMCDDFRVDARPTSVLPDPTAGTVLLDQVQYDAVWMAKLARGSSWPGEMAHNVEQAANRVIAAYGSDADRAAIAALLAGGGE